jgi:hypothetical protein
MRRIAFAVGLLLAGARANAEKVATVGVTVGCQDAAMKKQIESYLDRELRAITDVQITEKDPFVLLVITAIRTEGGDWAMAVNVTTPVYCGSQMQKERSLEEMWVYKGGSWEQLKEACDDIIVNLDRRWFKALRR